jgi:hypothetical protein
LFGSLGNEWRFPEIFSDFFTEKGKYIFHIEITSDDTLATTSLIELDWTGDRSTASLKNLTRHGASTLRDT